jgi:exonuclease III
MARLCLWGAEHMKPRSFWQRIIGRLPENVGSAVSKVQRVKQADGKYRFDITTQPIKCKTLLSHLRSVTDQLGWHVRRHRPWTQRERPSVRRSSTSPPPPSGMRLGLATWNIHGVRAKRGELEWFMKREHVSILCLQETLLQVHDWPLRSARYNCLEVPCESGETGRRGLAVLVDKNLLLAEVGARSPNWVWAKISTPGSASGLIVGCVYIPSQEGRLKCEVIRKLGDSCRAIRAHNPDTPIVMMGDWNMGVDAVQETIHKWGVAMVHARPRGSPLTYHVRKRHPIGKSALDHIAVSEEHRCGLVRPIVRRSWDCSDHWPLVGTVHLPGVQ